MSSKTIGTTRIVPFTLQEIFHVFEDPEILARWWGPEGFTNTFTEFEFRPDGKWSFVMHGPDGANYPNEWIFRTTDVGLIVIEHFTDHHFMLTMMFMAREGGTHIFWTQEFDDAEVAEKLRPFCEPGNEQNLDRLEAVLSGKL